MCGRFTLRTEPSAFWPAEQLSLFQPKYNIAPSQMVAVVRMIGAERRPASLQWGLVPSWAKDPKIGYRTINARSETIAEKPSFRDAFRQRRCLVLADGYYEWKAIGKKKQPYYIRMRDARPFAFAGLWESWMGSPGERRDVPLETCTVITTTSNKLTESVHDRMPAILHADDLPFWLDSKFQSTSKLTAMLRPYESDEMLMHPVSTIVNKPANDVPECVEEVPIAPGEP